MDAERALQQVILVLADVGIKARVDVGKHDVRDALAELCAQDLLVLAQVANLVEHLHRVGNALLQRFPTEKCRVAAFKHLAQAATKTCRLAALGHGRTPPGPNHARTIEVWHALQHFVPLLLLLEHAHSATVLANGDDTPNELGFELLESTAEAPSKWLG